VISETSLSRQSIALVLTTKNKETNTTYTLNTKEKQKKTALANRTIYTWTHMGQANTKCIQLS